MIASTKSDIPLTTNVVKSLLVEAIKMEMEAVQDLRALATADLLLKLSRRVEADANASDLKPAQWAALRYLAHATPSARTNKAFADYHQTTTGTVTITLKALVDKGLVERKPSTTDRRQVEFVVTQAGFEKLNEDPFRILVDAIETLNETQHFELIDALTEVTLHMMERQARASETLR